MRYKPHLAALIALSLIGASSQASAQNTGAAGGATAGVAPGTGGVPAVGTTTTNPGSAGISSAPGGSSTTTTGIGTGAGVNTGTSLNTGGFGQPGAPNTSVPGTGASPNDLPGDDPAHPGFPRRMGQ